MSPAPLADADRELLEAAARLLQEAGADGFTMDRLAEVTGLSRATLYRRLGSREAILQRLGEEGRVDAALAAQPDARTRILNAARAVFGRTGVAEASIEEIAREAGVGPATVYRHFKDRDGLLQTFMEQSRPAAWLHELHEPPSTDIETELFAIVHQLVRNAHQNGDLLLLMLTESRRSPELLARMSMRPERTQYRMAAWLEARIQAGWLEPGDPFEMAGALMGMVMSLGVLMPTLYGRPVDDPDRVARFIVDLFLDGLRAGDGRQV